MNYVPRIKRRKHRAMNVQAPARVDCAGHLKWVRGHICLVEGVNGHTCSGRIEAHHVISRGAGGGDEQVVPLCSGAHDDGHLRGWDTFARDYGVDLDKIAAAFWQQSPHRARYEREWREMWNDTPLPYKDLSK